MNTETAELLIKKDKSKEYCKADNNVQCIAFLEQYFGWEYHPSSGVQMLQNRKNLKKAGMASRNIVLKEQYTLLSAL